MRSRVESEALTYNLKGFLENLEKLIRVQEQDSKVAFLMSNVPRTSSSHLLSLMSYNPQNRTENIFKQIILEYVLKAEKTSALSSGIMIRMFIDLYRRNDKLERIQEKKSSVLLKQEVENILRDVQELMSRPDLLTLEDFLHRNFHFSVSSLVLESLKIAGPTGKITFEHSNVPRPIIEADTSYIFDIIPDQNLLILNDFEWKKNDVSILCIEGFIEKVSEIDSILTSLSEQKKSAVIICLGYSDEIISTVMANNRRGTFDVMLCRPSEEDSAMNDLFDIAAASGSCFYGFQTGAVSLAFKPEDLERSSEEVVISSDKLRIKNSFSQRAANERAQKIKNQLGESDLKDDYLKRRITSLTSNHVKIILPESTAQDKFSQIEEIDAALRCSNAITRYGVIDVPEDSIIPCEGRQIASSIYIGCKFGYELFKKISAISHAIVLED